MSQAQILFIVQGLACSRNCLLALVEELVHSKDPKNDASQRLAPVGLLLSYVVGDSPEETQGMQVGEELSLLCPDVVGEEDNNATRLL